MQNIHWKVLFLSIIFLLKKKKESQKQASSLLHSSSLMFAQSLTINIHQQGFFIICLNYLDTPLCITYSSLSSFFTFFPLSGYALPPPPGWGCHFFQVSHPGIGTMTSISISAVGVISSRVRIEWSGQISPVWITLIPNPASISSMSPVSKSTRHSENQQ